MMRLDLKAPLLAHELLQKLGSGTVGLVRRLGPAGLVGAVAVVAALMAAKGHADATRELEERIQQRVLASRVAKASQASELAESSRRETGDTALAARADALEVVGEIHRIARLLEIEPDKARYDWVPGQGPMPAAFEIAMPVQASYRQLRAFVIACLNAMPALALRDFTLRRDPANAQLLNARIRFALLLREDAP